MVLEYLPDWVDADVRAATSLAAPLEAAAEKQRAQAQLPHVEWLELDVCLALHAEKLVQVLLVFRQLLLLAVT